MRISYKSHPILKILRKTAIDRFPVYESDVAFFKNNMDNFIGLIQRCLPYFDETISLSKTFLEAVVASSKKLAPIYLDALQGDEDFHMSGIFLGGNNIFYLHHTKEKGNLETYFFSFTKEGLPLCFYVGAPPYLISWVSNSFNLKSKDEVDLFIADNITSIALIHLFKQYAEVETKLLPAGQKIKDVKCNYKNDTDFDITYLDSKWFTNLVKSDAFKVRGHFRLQPKKKKGEWTKELIWINDFEKHGYTSHAKILSE